MNPYADFQGHAAVIVLHEEATNSLVLTQRSPHLPNHPGEICFPGGYWEPQDATLWHTALRELDEELTISAERITLINELSQEKTRQSVWIKPWFARIATLAPYAINPQEVAAIITIPFEEVLTLSNYETIHLDYEGHLFPSCHFIASSYFIWGATARIMQQLAKSL